MHGTGTPRPRRALRPSTCTGDACHRPEGPRDDLSPSTAVPDLNRSSSLSVLAESAWIMSATSYRVTPAWAFVATEFAEPCNNIYGTLHSSY